MRLLILCLALILVPALRSGAEEPLGLAAPDEVVASGLLRHILPRFSLKTGVRISLDPGAEMVLSATGPGTAVFQRGTTVYQLRITDDPLQIRFQDWLTSEIGTRTIESFQPSDGDAFTAPLPEAEEIAQIIYDGDPVLGEQLSLNHCGRCHVIGPQNAMHSIGSTPSFAVLRAMADWDFRFQQFYVLRPHGAFTQVAGVTLPFDPSRPSPIAPVVMIIEDLEAILAYVAKVAPADLGAPLHLQ
ncbi:MAG: hypothetical protein WAO69_03990 [Aestuariivita sp.]|uniref:hypothetical protein n=1 Tax=Aestuariivita sp. TaxID=1872407 RepID=UPI003BAF1856